LESLTHANIASVPKGEMTVWERRQWNSGLSWQPLHQAEVEAWEDRPWDTEPNWESQQFWASQDPPADSPGTSWTK